MENCESIIIIKRKKKCKLHKIVDASHVPTKKRYNNNKQLY